MRLSQPSQPPHNETGSIVVVVVVVVVVVNQIAALLFTISYSPSIGKNTR